MGPHLPAAAKQGRKAQGAFNSVVVCAIKSIRHII